MKQEERKEKSKEEIYQAALEEFGTYGYDNVSIEQICNRHGISKGMMYHYYSSKDQLFLLCVERTCSDYKSCNINFSLLKSLNPFCHNAFTVSLV